MEQRRKVIAVIDFFTLFMFSGTLDKAKASGKVTCSGHFMANSFISMIPLFSLTITKNLSSTIYHPHMIFSFNFDKFSVSLISNRSYVFWVHDPDFFLPSINPDIFPHAGVRIENKPKIIWIYLRPVYYERLSKFGGM